MSGRFVWYELFTTDTRAAISFYTEVVGWKTQLFDEQQAAGKEPYTMWVAGQGPLGGVVTLPEEAKKMGAPPHWMGNVDVDDLDAKIAKAKSLGASIVVPPMPIPKIGRYSLIADPQGAHLALVQFDQPLAPHDATKPGEISWSELTTTDAEKALAFYGELFGWQKLSQMDMGDYGTYYIYGQGDKQYGGMMNKSPDMPMPPAFTYYINVEDLDAAMERAKSRGAKHIYGPQEVPGGTRVAQLFDPQGAVFALHGPAKK